MSCPFLPVAFAAFSRDIYALLPDPARVSEAGFLALSNEGDIYDIGAEGASVITLAELDVSIQDYQDLAAETESGFEAGGLVGTVTNVAMEYKRLPGLHDALWAIFKGVKNRSRSVSRKITARRKAFASSRVI